jgi:hypothetical protein
MVFREASLAIAAMTTGSVDYFVHGFARDPSAAVVFELFGNQIQGLDRALIYTTT